MGEPDKNNSRRSDVDLTNCDREPIHILGSIQPYGCLLSTSADMMINHMSTNCLDLLGLDPDKAVGVRLTDLLPAQTVHDLRSKLQVGSVSGGVARIFAYDVLGDGQLFDISMHRSGRSFILEFEPKTQDAARDDLNLVQPLITRIRRQEGVQNAAREAAAAMQMLSGFDRVMVYRFAPDQSGEVIAERCAPDMEPFLGLRYPASDIPQQARELYKRSLLRLIADVDAPVCPIVPETSPTGEPLDLSLSVTRAVSPIHLEYLRNMGVAASMSVSILKNGELWGLLACHNKTPHYVDFERRSAIELFAQFFSYELERMVEAETRENERRSRDLHDRLMVRLSSGSDMIENFSIVADELAGIIPSDGVAVYSGGLYAARGDAPTQEDFMPLARFLNTAPMGKVFACDNLSAVFPQAEALGDRVAGLLSIPISRTPRDYIVFFRREIARSVTWAGNPEKPVEVGPNGVRLTPRKSFEAWTEMVRGTCESWSRSELQIAEALRVSLIEIVLKLTDEANLQRREATEKQELLIAELNHRVRNILNLIQGLVAQSKSGAGDLASFTKVLDGRIQSLARAHDQLTKKDWSASSLRDLIKVEAEAFLNGQEGRLQIEGDTPYLAPEAFSAMALVVHELVTNAAKYGALTDRSGKVRIDLIIGEDGALQIKWRERGGPPVQVPKHRGFGSTIIDRTVPFELNGTVETRFKPSGFEADIVLPAPLVTAGEETEAEAAATDAAVDTANQTPLSGHALVLEDNMVIALEASDLLSEFGAAQVEMASNVDSALAIIAEREIEFAVLDVNLRDQTSLPVAEVLHGAGIPFVLATGYGDLESILGGFPITKVITKPYSSEDLLRAVQQAMTPKG